MLTISKNLVWPRDLESFKGGNFNTPSIVDCYVQICNGTAVIIIYIQNVNDVRNREVLCGGIIEDS